MPNINIERRIIIGFITSTDFLKEVRELYNSRYLEAAMAKRIASWCIEYFDKYEKAPGLDIEGIYYEKVKAGLPKDLAEEIEQDILPDLSEEYVNAPINVAYLVDETIKHFSEQHLKLHSEKIKALTEEGELVEAENLALNYKPPVKDAGNSVDFKDEKTLDKIEKAFTEAQTPLIKYPKQLGTFWNHQFVRGGFIAFMGPEKRGKTFLLMDLIARASRQKLNVAFFQAGDMTENQQIRRFCIHLTKKSDMERYCGKMFQPMRDCKHNQRDTCSKKIRECDFGVFENLTEEQIRKEMTIEQLKEAYEENRDYKPCWNCKEYQIKPWGSVWLEEVNVGNPLSVKEAKAAWRRFFIKNKRNVMMSTHANGTLSIKGMNSILDLWEKLYGFVADIIVFDYADIAEPDGKTEFRHQQNQIWKDMRSTSQKRHALFITVTQTDADSYGRNSLSMKNFSEDKRKYAHVTAMYGLNQDTKGREKKIGIMRINEILIREGEFNTANEIYVLQNLKRGMPYLGSFF